MIGIVVVTHGRLAHELVEALRHVIGVRDRIAAVGIAAGDDLEDCRASVAAAVASVDGGAGVVVLTDMLGGTPSNLAASVAETRGDGCAVVAGVNLPMLVKLARLEDGVGAGKAARQVRDAGRKYIRIAAAGRKKTGSRRIGGRKAGNGKGRP